MKRMILASLLFLSMGTIAFAQQNHRKREFKMAEERAKRQTERLAQELSLSEEQKKEIYAINLDNMKKVDAEHKELMQKSMKERDEKISELLTEAQKSTYQKLKKERFQKRKHRESHRGMGKSAEEIPQS
ncbi:MULTISPECIES: DUF4890 domain-containing protein [Olivibacter]|jgi:Spy/CpxP family protein refolding chaperone|uniref:DUF4890 domain-containing protein n=1 Tax=Olivibacter oleidegradans TaxID=760123 RepID=A0ABV6HK03_9SPHI|nr:MULTISPECIES: DUF4890 domain-containing protein [Olivibacter]MDM8174532.1 hypothetical protein [Olivibacter sp. 47]QEL01340.1 DUF4890 domain-containing protein [Olivibacter sp. LS-1]